MTPFRRSITDEISRAAKSGQSYDDILRDMAVSIGCLIKAGSQDHDFRMKRVRATAVTIKEILEAHS